MINPPGSFHHAAWRDEGVLTRLNHDLTGLARVEEGRKPEPTAAPPPRRPAVPLSR